MTAAQGGANPAASGTGVFNRNVLDIDCAAEVRRIEEAVRHSVGQRLRRPEVGVVPSG